MRVGSDRWPPPSQWRMEPARMITAAVMISAVSEVLMYPCAAFSGSCVSGQKMSVIDSQPATRVVTPTKLSGRIVTQQYRPCPELMMIVVATHSATAASSWLAMPNIGQIVEIEPDQMNAAQAVTTTAVVRTDAR